jgi:hypothetical protein
MEPNVELVIASDIKTREAVYRFRQDLAIEHRLPVDVLPGGYQGTSPVGLQDLLDPFAIVAAAIDRSTSAIVGAVRTNYLREGAIPLYPSLYRLGDLPGSTVMSSSVTTCWTMSPAFRCSTSSRLTDPAVGLAWSLYDLALRQRICHDFLDCADVDVLFFSRLGYRLVREIEHPLRGRSNLMRLDIYDWSYLAEIDSPFLALARGVA